jgi:hypothetical protein
MTGRAAGDLCLVLQMKNARGREGQVRRHALEIENCSWKFKFQCPRLWGGLHPTDDPNVRVCESCLERVYLCKTEAEVLDRSKRGECVALGFFRGGGLLGRVIEKSTPGGAE